MKLSMALASRLTKACQCCFGAHDSHPAHGTNISSSWFDFQETMTQMCLGKIVEYEEGGCFSRNWVILLPSVASESILMLHHQINLLSSG